MNAGKTIILIIGIIASMCIPAYVATKAYQEIVANNDIYLLGLTVTIIAILLGWFGGKFTREHFFEDNDSVLSIICSIMVGVIIFLIILFGLYFINRFYHDALYIIDAILIGMYTLLICVVMTFLGYKALE